MPISTSSQFDLNAQLPLRKYSVVNNLTDRNAIPEINRHAGFDCYVIAENKTYKLVGGITNDEWEVNISTEIEKYLSGVTVNNINDVDFTIEHGDDIIGIDFSHTHPWTDIAETPTTEDGYGITDGFTSWDKDYNDLINKPSIAYASTIGIGDLDDVDTTGITNGKILKYNSTSGNWEITDDNNTTYVSSDFNHDELVNTHNLTTDINHTLISNIGTNTHAQIDTHIADTSIHFSDLSGFDTDDLTEGSTNLYSQWVTSGSDIYYNTGNVGIGTSSPETLLHTSTSGSGEQVISIFENSINEGGSKSSLQLRNYTTDVCSVKIISHRATASAGSDLVFELSDSTGIFQERMRINENGNVGIGTTSPFSKLVVYQENDTDENIVWGHATGTNAGVRGFLGTESRNSIIKLYNSGQNFGAIIRSSGDSYFNGGKVGIGTANPSYTLDVNGTGRFTDKLYLGTTTAPATDTGTLNALVWDSSTGEVKQRAISGSVNYGTDGQIPFMSGTTAFTYSNNFKWDGTRLTIISSSSSVLIGNNVAGSITSTGYSNIAIGNGTGATLGGGDYNILLGRNAGNTIDVSAYNIIIGDEAGQGDLGSSNTIMGVDAGKVNTSSYNVFLGAYAGKYETQGETLFIDSYDRADVSTARTSSLIYGKFNTVTSNQLLRVNGDLNIKYDLDHDGSNIGFFGTTPTTKQTALTSSDTSTVDTTYGTEEADVINNLRTRVNELETKLQAYGLLS